MARDLSKPDHLPKLAARSATAGIFLAARAAAGHHPTDDRAISRLRRLRRRGHLGFRHHKGGRRPPAPAIGPSLLHDRRGADTPGLLRHCASPRTTSPVSPSPRWSTRSWPPAVSTATSTPTCPTTARHGDWSSAGLDEAAESLYGHGHLRRSRTRYPGGHRRLAGQGRAVRWVGGPSSTSSGHGRCACEWSWPRSTPIRGRGTRSASAGPHIRGGTCAWDRRAPGSPSNRPGRPTKTPCGSPRSPASVKPHTG